MPLPLPEPMPPPEPLPNPEPDPPPCEASAICGDWGTPMFGMFGLSGSLICWGIITAGSTASLG
jgi:hypothetical protein